MKDDGQAEQRERQPNTRDLEDVEEGHVLPCGGEEAGYEVRTAVRKVTYRKAIDAGR